jgi:hypothetical protein
MWVALAAVIVHPQVQKSQKKKIAAMDFVPSGKAWQYTRSNLSPVAAPLSFE